MKNNLLTQINSALGNLPVFRQSAQRVLALSKDTQCKATDWIETIYNDPALTLQVLKVVNSSYYNLHHKVSTVEHALVHMGINPIKNLLLPLTCKGRFVEDVLPDLNTHEYLLYVLGTAHVARQLAIQMQLADPTECFVAGLLHDFSKLAFASAAPIELKRALEYSQSQAKPLHQALQETLHMSDSDFSADWLQTWNLSPALIQSVRCQHQVQNIDMNICVFAAIQIIKHVHFGSGGDNHVTAFPDFVVERLGGDLEQVVSSWHDLKPMLNNITSKVQT